MELLASSQWQARDWRLGTGDWGLGKLQRSLLQPPAPYPQRSLVLVGSCFPSPQPPAPSATLWLVALRFTSPQSPVPSPFRCPAVAPPTLVIVTPL